MSRTPEILQEDLPDGTVRLRYALDRVRRVHPAVAEYCALDMQNEVNTFKAAAKMKQGILAATAMIDTVEKSLTNVPYNLHFQAEHLREVIKILKESLPEQA